MYCNRKTICAVPPHGLIIHQAFCDTMKTVEVMWKQKSRSKKSLKSLITTKICCSVTSKQYAFLTVHQDSHDLMKTLGGENWWTDRHPRVYHNTLPLPRGGVHVILAGYTVVAEYNKRNKVKLRLDVFIFDRKTNTFVTRCYMGIMDPI